MGKRKKEQSDGLREWVDAIRKLSQNETDAEPEREPEPSSPSDLIRAYWTQPTGWPALDYWREWIQDVIDSGVTLPGGADPRALRSFLRAVAIKSRASEEGRS